MLKNIGLKVNVKKKYGLCNWGKKIYFIIVKLRRKNRSCYKKDGKCLYYEKCVCIFLWEGGVFDVENLNYGNNILCLVEKLEIKYLLYLYFEIFFLLELRVNLFRLI